MSGGVFLNIDRIVLDGFDHIDRRELAMALQQALTEQLASPGMNRSSAMPLARTRITLQEPFSAAQLGQSLASGLCGVILSTGVASSAKRESENGAEHDA